MAWTCGTEPERMLLRKVRQPAVDTAVGSGITGRLRDRHIDHCIEDNRPQIDDDAAICGVDPRTFEHQVRLHLPSLERRLLRAGGAAAYRAVRPIALVRSAGIGQELKQAELRANASLLLPKVYEVRRGLRLVAPDSTELPLSFRQVKPSIGNIYQSRLHYLRSVRSDTLMHFGVFLPGAEYPLTYVALSVCDRPYISDSLVTTMLDCRREDCLVVTRMYGLPRIPRYLMSLTLKYVIQSLRRVGSARILLTAYNPLLGFDGAAFRASGFRPFATAPVSYWYTKLGEFTTRRNGQAAYQADHTMPPNVLMLRGINRAVQRGISKSVDFINISSADYRQKVRVDGRLPPLPAHVWLKRLRGYRRRLQEAWSDRTVHPSYLGDAFDPGSSRGQCGVSSVWLARELYIKHGLECTYCYGDLLFPWGDSQPVKHHCWLEVGPESDPSRVVIDLTCDQASGLDEPVLCAPHDELLARGLSYRSHTRSKISELPSDRVWYRYEQLIDAMVDGAGPALEEDRGGGGEQEATASLIEPQAAIRPGYSHRTGIARRGNDPVPVR